jgi:hypothetical protein
MLRRMQEEGGCVDDECPPLSLTKEVDLALLAFSHGNPEHRFTVDLLAVASDDDWESRVVDWLRRLHAHERGERTRTADEG